MFPKGRHPPAECLERILHCCKTDVHMEEAPCALFSPMHPHVTGKDFARNGAQILQNVRVLPKYHPLQCLFLQNALIPRHLDYFLQIPVLYVCFNASEYFSNTRISFSIAYLTAPANA
ncbi:helicase SKI2W [Platysternon megacephalum]|uniref:Helicase SKI2W n=1 Tax=Platysternon megacephalum TaxID=55544 RepID=A0A4D9DEM1_9SAUR|nr:helicase SKI2W [Platysternon megacephalum]